MLHTDRQGQVRTGRAASCSTTAQKRTCKASFSALKPSFVSPLEVARHALERVLDVFLIGVCKLGGKKLSSSTSQRHDATAFPKDADDLVFRDLIRERFSAHQPPARTAYTSRRTEIGKCVACLWQRYGPTATQKRTIMLLIGAAGVSFADERGSTSTLERVLR